MKKISIFLIAIILLSSCKTKRNTTKTHTNTRKVEDREVVRSKNKEKQNTKVEKLVEKEIEITNTTNQVVIKTTYNSQLIDNLYANQPNLNTSKISYIKKYSELAINEMEAYKIPASITLAQGLLESRYGQSELTKKSKNHFGIKCHKWTGKRVYHDDDSKGECFRKYDYDANSYRDHSLFLANKKRYKKLFTYAPNDYKSWARGLRKAGYATDKRYPNKLIGLIEEYKLYTFDKLVLGDNYHPIVNTTENTQTHHIVEIGETLYSISGKYYVSISDIKRFNNLRANTISVGQKLLLIGDNTNIVKVLKTHIVIKGDTIYSLSKKYNLTADKLKTLNNLNTNSLAIGQKLYIE